MNLWIPCLPICISENLDNGVAIMWLSYVLALLFSESWVKDGFLDCHVSVDSCGCRFVYQKLWIFGVAIFLTELYVNTFIFVILCYVGVNSVPTKLYARSFKYLRLLLFD